METLRTGTEWFRVDSVNAAGSVRRAAMRLATRVGFSEIRTAETGIIASEATANLWQHAEEGMVALQIALRHNGPGVQIIAIDRGPGMADVPLSSLDGHSTAGTLGVGLGAITRLASAFDVSSHLGRGTVLVADVWPRSALPPNPVDVGALTRPIAGEEMCGDAVGARLSADWQVLMLADGLGHGPLAASSSIEALAAFHETSSTDPATILATMHARIGHTRGAAVAVAAIDPSFRRLRFAGVGNVSAFIDNGVRRQAAVSHPGIVGHNMPRPRQFELELHADDLLIMHSDGVRESWSLRDSPGLHRRSSTVIAASVLRDAGGRPDDAAVLVARRRR